MIGANPREMPDGAALRQRQFRTMDIVFHLGAHRTGAATFQAFMRDNAQVLKEADIAYWGPKTTRNGLFHGLIPSGSHAQSGNQAQDRAEGRVKLRLAHARQSGARTVLVSDQTMIGSLRGCIRDCALYPGIGERMARYARAFDGEVTRIALSIRSPDRFWSSAIAHAVGRGHGIPDPRTLRAIAASERSWRDVITDLACAVPSAEIRVLPYESFYANPITLAHQAAGLDVVLRGRYEWLNRAPDLPTLRGLMTERGEDASRLPEGDGQWEPFGMEEAIAMRERFADDLFWLAQGAGGLARLTEEAMPRERGQARRAGTMRGHDHDRQVRLDQTG